MQLMPPARWHRSLHARVYFNLAGVDDCISLSESIRRITGIRSVPRASRSLSVSVVSTFVFPALSRARPPAKAVLPPHFRPHKSCLRLQTPVRPPQRCACSAVVVLPQPFVAHLGLIGWFWEPQVCSWNGSCLCRAWAWPAMCVLFTVLHQCRHNIARIQLSM